MQNPEHNTHIVDTRGYSCPRPKHMVSEILLHQSPARLQALIDDYSTVDALMRLAPSFGYKVTETKREYWTELNFTKEKA